ncbi:MAG: hypothetical protein ACYDFT_00010 [Thermoplasmata archaeon]
MADNSSRTARVYGGLFLLAFLLSVWMLLTDNNLKTNFGLQSSGYFVHWYVIAVLTLADLAGGILLLAVGTRRAVAAGVFGSGLAVLIFLGAILTYAQVGGGYFTSPTEFAKYLFGITPSVGDVRYLYDGLLAVTFAAGLAILRRRPSPHSTAPAAWNSKPPASGPEGGAPRA